MRSPYHAHCLSTPSMTVSWISDITIILLKFEAIVSLNIDKTLISNRFHAGSPRILDFYELVLDVLQKLLSSFKINRVYYYYFTKPIWRSMIRLAPNMSDCIKNCANTFTHVFDEIWVHHRRAQSEHETMADDNETHRYEFQPVNAFQIVRSLREREQLAYVSRQRERLEHEVFPRFLCNSSL